MKSFELNEQEIEYTPVVSSWIEEIGWDGADLYLKLIEGQEYVYYNFDPDLVEHMLQADSHGSFFHEYVKGYYAYSRIV